jgi:uncharacterized protein (DUF2336 family)
MNLALSNLVNADRLEKVVLAKRVSRFLASSGHEDADYEAVTNVARALAQDLSIQVRETLSFELRLCGHIPYDLAARIASDIESVAGPFIEATLAFSDGEWAGLVPHLQDHAHAKLARRHDLGEQTGFALVLNGTAETVTSVMANREIRLSERVCNKAVDRFSGNDPVMQEMSRRDDLTLAVVERIIGLVAEEYKRILLANYSLPKRLVAEIVFKTQHETLWKRIAQAGPAQVHGYVVDLKREGRLSEMLTLEMVERGSFQFLGSALAVEAGVTLGEVRGILEKGDLRDVLRLIHSAGFGKTSAQRICRVLRENQIEVRRSAI